MRNRHAHNAHKAYWRHRWLKCITKPDAIKQIAPPPISQGLQEWCFVSWLLRCPPPRSPTWRQAIAWEQEQLSEDIWVIWNHMSMIARTTIQGYIICAKVGAFVQYGYLWACVKYVGRMCICMYCCLSSLFLDWLDRQLACDCVSECLACVYYGFITFVYDTCLYVSVCVHHVVVFCCVVLYCISCSKYVELLVLFVLDIFQTLQKATISDRRSWWSYVSMRIAKN
jgi:hypothetical protein